MALKTLRRPARLAIAACFAVLLGSCSRRPQDAWVRDSLEAGKSHEARWAPYHWYFPEITYTLSARWSLEGHYSGPLIHVTLAMAAKALTEEGAAMVGTLHLEGWNSNVVRLEVLHLDSTGRRVSFPEDEMLRTFRKRGVVVVPQVAKGSTVSIRLVQGPFSSMNAWEISLDRSVPVLLGRVRMAAAKGISFDMKGYGLSGPEVTKGKRFAPPTLTWTAREVAPFADLPFADGVSARPRFLITNRDNAHGTTYRDWKAVAREARKGPFATGLLDLKGDAEELARSVADQGSSEAGHPDRARRILAWVQDHVTVSDGDARVVATGTVLERRKGSEEQVASLLATLFRAAGLEAAIVLSRRRDRGGLDPEAVNPNAAATPLVIVTAGGREWVAWFQDAAHALGDYPAGFQGMQALSLETGALRTLPEPAQGRAVLTVIQDVPLDGNSFRKASLEAEGPLAADLRADWIEGLSGDPLEGCRRSLKALGFTASIRKCAEQGLNERDRPFRLTLEIENRGTWIEVDSALTWNAPDLFSRPAWFYDSARVEPYLIPRELVRRETVRFKAPPGKSLAADFPCREVRTDFLQVDCRPGGTPQAPTFTRETVIRPGRHPAGALKSMHAELTGLDRIRDARVRSR